MQVKYRQDGRKEASASLYHRLPVTTETQLAKEQRDACSEVRSSRTDGKEHLFICNKPCAWSSGEVQRRGEEAGDEELVLAPPGDARDAARQAAVRDTE